MPKILFFCSANKQCSKMAEDYFALKFSEHEFLSVGTVEKYIEDQIERKFSELNYERSGKWFRRKDKKYDPYFYVLPASELLRHNKLWLCFEIRNQTNKQMSSSDIIRSVQKLFQDHDYLNTTDLKATRIQTHSFIYSKRDFFTSDYSFKDELKNIFYLLIEEKDRTVKKVENYLRVTKVLNKG